MSSLLTSILGRILPVSITLSGICLSMFFGMPPAQAMESANKIVSPDISVDCDVTMTDTQDFSECFMCCVGTRSQHEIEVATNNEQIKIGTTISASLPHVTFRLPNKFLY